METIPHLKYEESRKGAAEKDDESRGFSKEPLNFPLNVDFPFSPLVIHFVFNNLDRVTIGPSLYSFFGSFLQSINGLSARIKFKKNKKNLSLTAAR